MSYVVPLVADGPAKPNTLGDVSDADASRKKPKGKKGY